MSIAYSLAVLRGQLFALTLGNNPSRCGRQRDTPHAAMRVVRRTAGTDEIREVVGGRFSSEGRWLNTHIDNLQDTILTLPVYCDAESKPLDAAIPSGPRRAELACESTEYPAVAKNPSSQLGGQSQRSSHQPYPITGAYLLVSNLEYGLPT